MRVLQHLCDPSALTRGTAIVNVHRGEKFEEAKRCLRASEASAKKMLCSSEASAKEVLLLLPTEAPARVRAKRAHSRVLLLLPTKVRASE